MTNQIKFTLVLTAIGIGAYFLFKEDPTNILIGGKGDDLSEEDVDQDEFKKGLEVEMEHTRNKKIAKEITLDHLAEDKNYYTKLEAIHKENPKKKKKKKK
jgi:hypothetical protein